MNLFFIDNSSQHSQFCFNISTAWVKLKQPSGCQEAVPVLPLSPSSTPVLAVITPHLLLSLSQSFLHIISCHSV